MLESGTEQPGDRHMHLVLSPREHEVMEAVSLGLTNRQVADRLTVSVHAVKFHLASIYRKHGIANRTEAASLYLRESRRLAERAGSR
jgi:DNA-binding NarL/FixJ family response regulator